jgi:hypothetical protein
VTLLIWGVNHRMAWMVGDNRYYLNANNKYNHAKKIFEVQATNAHGLIGYSGVGARVRPDGSLFELSGWLENLFDGQKFTLEQAIGRIRGAAIERRFGEMSGAVHSFAFAGYHDGQPKIIMLMSRPKRGRAHVTQFHGSTGQVGLHLVDDDYKPIVVGPSLGSMTGGRLGSGSRFVTDRDVLYANRVVNSRKNDQQAARRLNAYLARLVAEVSRQEGNHTVGPECLFAVRFAASGGFHEWTPRSSHHGREAFLPGILSGIKMSEFVKIWRETFVEAMKREQRPYTAETMRMAMEAGSNEFVDRINKVKAEPSDKF